MFSTDIYTKAIAKFNNTIWFPFSTAVSKQDVRNFALFKDFKGPWSCRNSIRPKHQDTIDIKGKGVIRSWGATADLSFAMLREVMEAASAIRYDLGRWSQM